MKVEIISAKGFSSKGISRKYGKALKDFSFVCEDDKCFIDLKKADDIFKLSEAVGYNLVTRFGIKGEKYLIIYDGYLE